MGGWKSQKTVGVKLDPATVKAAVDIFVDVLDQFNQFLEADDLAPVEPLRPVGSTSYVDTDLEENPDKVYGDIDYLVSFPFVDSELDAGSRKNAEKATEKTYVGKWVQFLREQRPQSVAIEDTLKSFPLLTIIQLLDGRHVQVDIIITFPRYQAWMGGRYTPERNRKGLVMGKLYTALGNVIKMSIGTTGVIAKTRDGERVSSRTRKGVTTTSVSTNIQNFLLDIAKNIVGTDELNIHPLLKAYPGLNPENIDIKDFAKGIFGLGHTLAAHDIVTSGEDFAIQVADEYTKSMRNELVNPKYKKATTPEQFAMIDKTKKQVESGIADVDSILRVSVQETMLRKYVKSMLKETAGERLLRELIRETLLVEVGPEAYGPADIDKVFSIFTSSINPMEIAAAEAGKLVGSVATVVQVVLAGLKSFFSSKDYQKRYQEIFVHEKARAQAIETKYQDAYTAMERGWDEEGWKIPFMFEPAAFIAITAAQKSVTAAYDAAWALVGPRWESPAVEARMKEEQKLHRAYKRYLTYDKRRRKHRKPVKKEAHALTGRLIRELDEQDDQALITMFLNHPTTIDVIDSSPTAQKMKQDGAALVAATTREVVDVAKETANANSLEDLNQKTEVNIELPAEVTDPSAIKRAEASILEFASAASKEQATNILNKHYQEMGLTKIPEGEEVVEDAEEEIEKL